MVLDFDVMYKKRNDIVGTTIDKIKDKEFFFIAGLNCCDTRFDLRTFI